MRQVVVASENPVKMRAARRAFARMFPGHGFEVRSAAVPSGVDHQPSSDRETYEGARTRALGARERLPEADFWVGIEGGVEDTPDGMLAFAWVVVVSRGRTGRARTGTFVLPEPVARLVREGRELGEADDLVFGRENSKQEEGAIGLLTGNVVDRTALYEHAVMLALAPFKSAEIYGRTEP